MCDYLGDGRFVWVLNRLHTQPGLGFSMRAWEKRAVLGRIRAAAMPAMANLQKLAAQGV